MDGPINRPTERWTDRPSYRDVRKHLKMKTLTSCHHDALLAVWTLYPQRERKRERGEANKETDGQTDRAGTTKVQLRPMVAHSRLA